MYIGHILYASHTYVYVHTVYLLHAYTYIYIRPGSACYKNCMEFAR